MSIPDLSPFIECRLGTLLIPDEWFSCTIFFLFSFLFHAKLIQTREFFRWIVRESAHNVDVALFCYRVIPTVGFCWKNNWDLAYVFIWIHTSDAPWKFLFRQRYTKNAFISTFFFSNSQYSDVFGGQMKRFSPTENDYFLYKLGK